MNNNNNNDDNSDIVKVMFLYPGSAEVVHTVIYFFDFHEIKDSPCLIMNHVTDVLGFGHAANICITEGN